MQSKTTILNASTPNTIVGRAKQALDPVYTTQELSAMTDADIVEHWQRMVCAEADAFRRSRGLF